MNWLYSWYYNHCNGDWEHANGIKIGTLDNPGWFIKISIEDTELETKHFDFLKLDRTENDWYRCLLEDKTFKGFCGPFNLPELLSIFRKWAEPNN